MAGLGGLSDKIREIITRVQGVVDGAIDRVIDWIVAQANRLFRGNREDNRNQQNPQQDAQVTRGLEAISAQERPFLDSGKITEQEAQQVASNVKSQHPVFRELRVVDGGDSWDYQYDAGERHRGRKDTAITQTPESGRVIQRAEQDDDKIEEIIIDFPCKQSLLPKIAEFKRQLKEADEVINNMTVEEYLKNRVEFFKRKEDAKKLGRKNPEGRDPKGTKKQQDIRKKNTLLLIDEITKDDPTLSFEEAKLKAEEMLEGKTANHKLDQIAGGKGDDVSDTLGDSQIDFSIGAAWHKRAKIIEAKIKNLQNKKKKLNITFTINGESID